MNQLIFISLFLLVTSVPVDKADATGFLSSLPDRLATLAYLPSLPNSSLPDKGAPTTLGTIKGSVPVHGSEERDLKLFAQSNSMSDSAPASKSARAYQEPGAQTDTAENSGKTTTSGNKCELTENGIVCNDNPEPETSRGPTGSDDPDGKGKMDTEEAVNKIKGFLDSLSNSVDR